MRRFRTWVLLVLSILPVCAPASAWAAKLSIQEQEKLLWQAVEDVFQETPDLAREARLLGVGSWMKGTAGSGSDIDITVGSRDAATERKLAERIQSRVNELAGGAEHKVYVTWRRDHLFEDRFRGEVGQKFFYDYADKSGDFRSCFVYEAGPDGLSRSRVSTERFWLDHDLAVPKNVEGAYRFVEDSVVFLERYATKPTLEQAEKAAKYLNNYESFLKGELRDRIGTTQGLDELSPAMQERMQAMLEYKSGAAKDPAGALERLRNRLGAESDAALEAEMRGFVRDTRRYLISARDDVELVEKLHNSGLLERAGGPAQAIRARDDLLSRIFQRAQVPLAALDAYMILKAYYEGGPEAAIMEASISLAGYAVPPALIAGLLAELAKEVFVAGVEWAGNALVFDPINDSFLSGQVYAPDSSINIFTWDQSPFKGLARETIACKFSSLEMVRAGVNRYLDQAKSWNAGLFATEGAGDVTPRLLSQMEADRLKSVDWLSERQQQGLLLALGDYERVPQPLGVIVNGGEAGQVLDISVPASPEAPALFDLRLNAEFGFGRIVPSNTGFYEQVTCERGLAGAAKWLKDNLVEQYRPGYDVVFTIRLGENKGWKYVGEWPRSGASVRLASEGNRFATRRFALQAVPTAAAQGDFTAELVLSCAYKEGFEEKSVQHVLRLRVAATPAALRVRVLDARTGRPVPGAGVAASGPAGLSGKTGNAGEVRFANIPAGQYALRAGAAGYQQGSGAATVTAGGEALASLSLTPLAQAPEPQPMKPEPKPEPVKVQPKAETPVQPMPQPKPQPKAEPKPEPKAAKPAGPTPEQACACLHQWKMGPEQQELVAATQQAYPDFCGAEMRAVQAMHLQDGRCAGNYEFWTCRKDAQGADNWWASSIWEGSVGVGEAAARCK